MRLSLRVCSTCAHLDRDHIGNKSRCQHQPRCLVECQRFVKAGGGNKYHNRQVGGADSAGEATWFAELRLAERAGAIRDLEVHHVLRIEPEGCEAIAYEADATFWELQKNGVWLWVIGDFKASITKTPLWTVKWKLTRWKYPQAILRVAERHRDRRRGIVIHDDPPRVVTEAA